MIPRRIYNQPISNGPNGASPTWLRAINDWEHDPCESDSPAIRPKNPAAHALDCLSPLAALEVLAPSQAPANAAAVPEFSSCAAPELARIHRRDQAEDAGRALTTETVTS